MRSQKHCAETIPQLRLLIARAQLGGGGVKHKGREEFKS